MPLLRPVLSMFLLYLSPDLDVVSEPFHPGVHVRVRPSESISLVATDKYNQHRISLMNLQNEKFLPIYIIDS